MENLINSIVRNSNKEFYITESSPLINIIRNTFRKCNIYHRFYKCEEFQLPSNCFDERVIDLRLWNNSKYCNVVYRSLLKLCRQCDEYAIIPIGLSSRISEGHMVVFIYIKSEKEFYLFDSSGATNRYHHLQDSLIFFFGDYKLINNSNQIQRIESLSPDFPEERSGYCCSWVCFFIYCYINLNRSERIDINMIVDKLLLYADSPLKLKQLIRRFSYISLNNRFIKL